MGKNLFNKPFDEGTIDKLEIFEDYFKEWLPVFISRQPIIWEEIQILDLFGGAGTDTKGIYGSPMRIIATLNQSKELIQKSKVKIRVVINEYDKEIYDLLTRNLELIADRTLYVLETYNEDFIVVFNKYFESMKRTPNFLFLDQNGIKQITEEIFQSLSGSSEQIFCFLYRRHI